MKQTEINKRRITVHKFVPKYTNDTFMACVSYWRYNTPRYRRYIRESILLHTSKMFFGIEYKSLDVLYEDFILGKLNFKNTCKIIKFKDSFDVIKFILHNSHCGSIVNITAMLHITSSYYNISIMFKQKRYGLNMQHTMFIKYDKQHKTFKLIVPVTGIHKTMTSKKYKLAVRPEAGKLTECGDFERVNDIHCFKFKNNDKDLIYTVIPINEYVHLNPIFIYVNKKDTNECKLVTSVKPIDRINPYFTIDIIGDVNVFVVKNSKLESANNALKYIKKINIS